MKYYQALAVLVGYIIGVGMFGLPFLTVKSGVLSFLILLFLIAIIQYFCNLIYASVILETESYHRLSGYAEVYLGKFWKHFCMAAKIVGNYGSLLAYIIITGIFLNQLLAPYFGGNEFFYGTILFALEALIIFFGVSSIGRAELVMTGLLLVTVAVLCIKGLFHAQIANYSMIDWKYFLLPYGAMLLALDGSGAIPLAVKLLKRDRRAVKKVVRQSTSIAAIVILFFVLSIVGVSGINTTADALTGIEGILENNIIGLALIFGVLTMVTSFLGVAEDMRESFVEDYKMKKFAAWFLALFVPYLLYLAGMRNLIAIISFAGAIAGGLSAIILILIFLKLRKEERHLILFKRKPKIFFLSLLILFFIAGMIYEVVMF
ncbi:MAG: aromatic amino acid transport family protein [Patescibacteria group bacterium]|nr:aromatic amino acid transport family protein [Patescibacteria group bacterium]MDD4611190.1 aromatic amino acid transport family protein [Patescibacteria group bacterium]